MGILDDVLGGIMGGVDAVGGAASAAAEVVGGAASSAAEAIGGAVGTAASDVYSSFGGSVGIEQDGNLKSEDGSYMLPEPTISEKESHELDVLKERYDKLNRPGMLARAGGAVGDAIPAAVKDAVGNASEAISDVELFKAAMNIVAEGFGAIEKQAASATVSPEYVVNRINRGKQEEKVSSIEEICLLRAYDVTRVVSAERTGHMGLAFAEGAATGAPGFPGIPFNLVLSTFLFFRAVQSVAMFYGYDVHADPDEMAYAGEVIMAAYGAGDQGANGSVAAGYIGKIMAVSEAEAAKQLVGKGWTAMASRGGIPLLLTQMRALAHASAKKALVNAGEKGLEKSIFASVFQQIGKRLTQSAIKGAVPVVGGIIGAIFDSGIMGRMLDFAEVYYHKRFILEKELRVSILTNGSTFFEEVEKTGGIDADAVVKEAEDAIIEDETEVDESVSEIDSLEDPGEQD